MYKNILKFVALFTLLINSTTVLFAAEPILSSFIIRSTKSLSKVQLKLPLLTSIVQFSTDSRFEEKTMKSKIQDTVRAERYFTEELEFTVNPRSVEAAVREGQPATIVDLRDEGSYASGHIPTAINMPYTKYNGFTGVNTEFPGLSRDKMNYLYCYEVFCNLSQVAAKKFASLGYPVKEMKGGFKAWQEYKYPVEK